MTHAAILGGPPCRGAQPGASTASRRARSVSRMSMSMRTWRGMLFTAPGSRLRVPTVPTVSSAPLVRAARSTAWITSAAATSGSWRTAISTAPAWPPSPGELDAQGGRGRDGGHHPDGHARALQVRALLDVELDEGGVGTRGQTGPGHGARDAGRGRRASSSDRPSRRAGARAARRSRPPPGPGSPGIRRRTGWAPRP